MRKFIVFLAAVFVLSAGCGIASEREDRYNSPKSDVITIGVVYPITSINVANTHFAKGLQFAVDVINNSGGVLDKRLDIAVRDDKNNANTAMQIAQTFIDRGITAVIGHWSTNISYYTQDIYEKNRIIMLTPRSTGLVLFEEEFDYIFRMVGSSQIFARAIASHVAEKRYRNIVIYFTDDVFGIDLAKNFEKELNALEVRVVDRVNSITSLNIELLSNRWRAFGCDAIIMAATYPAYVEPIRVIRRNGLQLPVYGDDSFERFTVEDLQYEYFDNLYTATLRRENLDTDFLEGFRVMYGHDPDAPAVNAYEAVMLIRDAMEATGSIDGTTMASFMSNLKDYKTVSGVRTYNPETQEFDGYNVFVIPVRPIIFGG
ncbi:MAG: ABC transporter substrate-binding protein [Chitinispirillales bacterium]|jgi:branched-chain amino acid transport system substrate-binding protein|nr:ABC transporter substrate-binding protein [Chitinispirillales bacterium]